MKTDLRFFFILMLITGFTIMGKDQLYAQKTKLDSIESVIAQNPNNDDQKARDLFFLAASNINSSPKKSLAYMDRILSFEKNIKDPLIVSSSYRVKGIILTMLASFPEALSALNTALTKDRQNRNAYGEAGDLSSIANIYLYQSNMPQALNYYQQSTKILSNIPEQDPKNYKERKRDEAAIYGNIGLVYLETGQYSKAVAHFKKAIFAHQKQKNRIGIVPALGNIANVYSKEKNYNKAILYADSAIKLADSLGDKISYARETGNLSGYYSNIGKYDQALSYGLSAIELNKSLGNTKSVGYNLQNVSSAYAKKGNERQAKEYGLAALKIGQDLKIPEIQRDASGGLSEIYEVLKMPDSALFYYKRAAILKDSINNSKKRDEIARLSIQYEFDKKETDYKQQEAIANEQLKQQQLQLALNAEQLNASKRLRSLQQVQLQNEKLQKEEKQKLLLIAQNNGKLQSVKVKQLSQQQRLNKLEMKQLWLYAVLVIVILLSILLFLFNKYRIKQLRFKNTLQQQQSEQLNRELSYQHQLSESELKAIRSQMNPHFIFNVLNSIESYIMDNDKKIASRLIQKFAALSRLILENSTRSLVSADREWKAIKLYTELEAMRYSNAFSYEFKLDERIELKALLLPPMLIQPLIENAILHGLIVETKAEAHLSISLEKNQTGICVSVADNGIGFEHQKTSKSFFQKGIKEKSIGLESIRERITMINKQNAANEASFSIKPGIKGIGTIAVICLPIVSVKR